VAFTDLLNRAERRTGSGARGEDFIAQRTGELLDADSPTLLMNHFYSYIRTRQSYILIVTTAFQVVKEFLQKNIRYIFNTPINTH